MDRRGRQPFSEHRPITRLMLKRFEALTVVANRAITRWLSAGCARLSQLFKLSGEHPSFPAMEQMACHCDEYSP